MSVTVGVPDSKLAARCQRWTFPAYRHLVGQSGPQARRLLADRRRVEPATLVAVDGGEPCGLVLGCVPATDVHSRREIGSEPELLSVCVAPRARRQGIATMLIGRLEDIVRKLGFDEICTVYMTGPQEIGFFERVLMKRGWTEPKPRMLIFRMNVANAVRFPWYQRHRRLGRLELFRWVEIRDEELSHLHASNSETNWIAEDLRPWIYDHSTLEPESSVGIRYDGEVVGWVINQRLNQETVRFTCSFIREDLARRGRIIPAYSESIRLAQEAGFRRLVFAVPSRHRQMASFVRRWCAPFTGELVETRSASKQLRKVHAPGE